MSESVVRWAMSSCSSGLAVTLAVALLLLPGQYLVPELATPRAAPPAPRPPPRLQLRLQRALELPPLELAVALALLLLGLLTYLCEWIQTKIMEKRIVKLNQYLSSSVSRLAAWESQQAQLEATRRLVQSAAAEYNLLLYLLLRQHARALQPLHKEPPAALLHA